MYNTKANEILSQNKKLSNRSKIFPIKINFDISVVFFFLFYIFLMRSLESEKYLLIGLMFVWIYVSFLIDIESFKNAIIKKNMLFVYIYIVYIFIISVFFEGLVTGLGYIAGQLTLFIGILMFNYYQSKWTKKDFENFLSVLFLIFGYYCIKALLFFDENPNAAREIVSHQGDKYGNIAIAGGYGLAYSSAILGVYILSLLISKKNLKTSVRLTFIIITLLSLEIAIQTGSTITLLSLLAGIVCIVYMYILGVRKRITLTYLIRYTSLTTVFISLFVLFLANIKNIGEWLLNISRASDTFLSTRFELIGIQMLYGETTGTLSARESLYKKSFEVFLEKPIFGTSYEQGFRVKSLIGGHSELLDQFATLGVIGGVPFILIFYQFIKYERKRNYQQISGAYILPFIIMFIFNPFHSNLPNFMLFFIIPALGILFSNDEDSIKFKLNMIDKTMVSRKHSL